MPTTDAPPRQKAVFFCPDCGHESPQHGDWKTVRAGDTVRIVCPDCSVVVARRPVQDTASVSPFAPLVTATDFVVDAWRLSIWVPGSPDGA